MKAAADLRLSPTCPKPVRSESPTSTKANTAASTWEPGGEPRVGRRACARLPRAARRRAGYRQIDPQPANRPGGQRPENPLCFGRRVGRADQDAGPASGHRQRRVSDLCRNSVGKYSGPDRRATARPGGHRLYPKPSIPTSSNRRPGAFRRSANVRHRCSNTPKRPEHRSSSSVTSPRTARSPARKSWSTSSMSYFSSKGTTT